LGFTYTPPTNEDRYLLFIDELRGRLVTLLGGRAAEEVVYSGRVSTGALDFLFFFAQQKANVLIGV